MLVLPLTVFDPQAAESDTPKESQAVLLWALLR